MLYFQAQKKSLKKFELKSEKKIKNNKTKRSKPSSPRQAKPTASPLQVARSRQAHRFSIKKKKKKKQRIEIEPITSAPAKITSRRWPGRDQSPLPNTKANQNKRTQQISKPNTLTQRTQS